MPSAFSSDGEARLRARVARLSPDAPAHFGQMDASRMICHLIDAYSNTLGENEAATVHGRLSNPIIRWLIIYVVPFPKNKVKTVPSYLRTKPIEWKGDLTRWSDLLTRLVARSHEPSPQWTPHPAFGALSSKDWGALIYKHTDHHFRQFGI